MLKLDLWKELLLLCAVSALVAISSPAQAFTSLASFDHKDGAYPLALVQGTDGNFYGPTVKGGTGPTYGCTGSCGVVFKVTPAGVLTTVLDFDGTDGNGPYEMLLATDGDFYGTSSYGGVHDCTSYGSTGACGGTHGDGTIFRITGGTLTTLHTFGDTNGALPLAGLIQGTSGTFYSTTVLRGADDDGTVFSLSVSLGPFVETLPTSGAAGTKITILGNKLKASTSVSFNGKAAKTFTVNSTGTAITTSVPSGATTGYVKVTTAAGATLTSSVESRVP
jgi:uncharacterized repeat protein (TIGR03803 family)